MMSRTLTALSAAATLFALAGCGTDDATKPGDEPKVASTMTQGARYDHMLEVLDYAGYATGGESASTRDAETDAELEALFGQRETGDFAEALNDIFGWTRDGEYFVETYQVSPVDPDSADEADGPGPFEVCFTSEHGAYLSVVESTDATVVEPTFLVGDGECSYDAQDAQVIYEPVGDQYGIVKGAHLMGDDWLTREAAQVQDDAADLGMTFELEYGDRRTLPKNLTEARAAAARLGLTDSPLAGYERHAGVGSRPPTFTACVTNEQTGDWALYDSAHRAVVGAGPPGASDTCAPTESKAVDKAVKVADEAVGVALLLEAEFDNTQEYPADLGAARELSDNEAVLSVDNTLSAYTTQGDSFTLCVTNTDSGDWAFYDSSAGGLTGLGAGTGGCRETGM